MILGVLDLVISALLCALLVIPNLMGISLYAVKTGSMEPALPVGSLMFVQPQDGADFQEGDVVTFRGQLHANNPSTTVITHRVMSNDTAASQLITKGDANAVEDFRPVPYASIIGKEVFSVPALGAIGTGLSTWGGKVSLIALVFGGLLLSLVGDHLLRRARPS